jgi:sulfatase modifying factor 1
VPSEPPGQPGACAWNSTFVADAACMAKACSGLGCLEHPQVCVDWCDADAYCRGVGQRLCGKIGGGAEAPADYASAGASQWFAACSAEGARAFPYGNGYHVDYCNGGDNQQTGCGKGGLCQTAIAGASPRCFADALDGGKVLDLSGNAWEWTDACAAGADGGVRASPCRIRGGSYLVAGDTRLRCIGDATLDVAPRASALPDVGFRCCSP